MTIDGMEILVLKEVVAEKLVDPAKIALIDAARRRLEESKAAHAQPTAILKNIRKRAEMEKALAEAEKQLPVPKDLDVEEQVQVKAKQQELAMLYADTPIIDPTTIVCTLRAS